LAISTVRRFFGGATDAAASDVVGDDDGGGGGDGGGAADVGINVDRLACACCGEKRLAKSCVVGPDMC
jgi:hypothetical protein